MWLLEFGAIFTASRAILGSKIKGPVFFDRTRTLKFIFYVQKWASTPIFKGYSKFAGWFMKLT